jgi:hypothetical protein
MSEASSAQRHRETVTYIVLPIKRRKETPKEYGQKFQRTIDGRCLTQDIHLTYYLLRGLYSASELYRLINRHLLVKFSANFCG